MLGTLLTARTRGRGLTLVELMVAIGLGAILIGVITFVWLQSNKIFSSTIHRLEAYQRLRIVLDQMERDLANTNRTVDMEFFQDNFPTAPAGPNGHFDSSTADTLLPTGSTGYPSSAPWWRQPVDPADPLVILSKPEFEDSDAWNNGINEHPYFFGPMVFSPSPYEITQDDYLSTRSYWRDEVYVRTFAMADGINRPAMIHYRLAPEANGRGALRRRIWFLNEQGQIVAPPGASTDRHAILATGLCDLKIGFYFKESASSISTTNGQWYHVGLHPSDGNAQHDALRDSDEQAGFLPARTAPGLSSQHVANLQFQTGTTGAPTWNAVAFFYQGFMRVSLVEGKVLLNPINGININTTDVAGFNNFSFPGVRPGDKILLSGAVEEPDDNDNYGAQASSVPGVNPFPDQVFTVESIISNGGGGIGSATAYVAIKLQEPISFPRLQRRWLKVEPTPGSGATFDYLPFDQPRAAAGFPVRKVEASFNCAYRVGFLPAAFRIRLSIDDKYNKKVLPMERVIRLLQQ